MGIDAKSVKELREKTGLPMMECKQALEKADGDISLAIAELRKAGFAVEVYPESRKLGAQLKFADRRGHEVAVIVGDDEWASGTCQLKHLATGESSEVPQEGLAEAIRALLAR